MCYRLQLVSIFTARRYDSCRPVSVCLSVCLSHSASHPITRSRAYKVRALAIHCGTLRKVTSTVYRQFADDTNLLVPENTDLKLAVEFSHIQYWAVRNAMIININKNEELVFH